jgi:hypothetical protein
VVIKTRLYRESFGVMSFYGRGLKQPAALAVVNVCFGSKADIQAAFGYYCWWARVLKFVEHHP